MNEFLSYTFAGLFTGAAYAIAASGLVLTYTTTRVFNLGHGAIGMVMAFLYWQLTVQHHMNRLGAALLIILVIAPILGVLLERVMMRGPRRRAGQREPGRHHRPVRAAHRRRPADLAGHEEPRSGADVLRRPTPSPSARSG